MQKGDVIAGLVEQVSREVKHSRKGQAYTGIRVNDSWFQVWGDRTNLPKGQHIELEVAWAPDNGPVFCTMSGGAHRQNIQRAEPLSIEAKLADLEERLRRVETRRCRR